MLDGRKVILDDECCLNNSAEIIEASCAGSVDATAKVFDTGGGYTKGMFVVDVSDYTGNSAAASCAAVDIILEGSATSTFTAYVPLAKFRLGQNAAAFAHSRLGSGYIGDASTGCSFTATSVRLMKPFHNLFAGTVYRYLRAYVAVMGTVSNVHIAYNAWISKY
jgi:hypothetical protein